MLYIYGATAHAKMAIEIAEDLGFTIGGLIDKSLLLEEVFNIPVKLGYEAGEYNGDTFFVAVQNAGLRERTVVDNGDKFYDTLVHHRAHVSRRAEIEDGTIVFPGAAINPDVQIGKHVLIANNAVIASNTIVEDFVNIGANTTVGTGVLIGKGTEVGDNVSIANGVTIGQYVTIEAGSILLDDIPDYACAKGSPAQPYAQNNR